MQQNESTLTSTIYQRQPILGSQKTFAKALPPLKALWYSPTSLLSAIITAFNQVIDLYQPAPAFVEIFEKYYDKKLLIISNAIEHYDYVITPDAPYEIACYTISA